MPRFTVLPPLLLALSLPLLASACVVSLDESLEGQELSAIKASSSVSGRFLAPASVLSLGDEQDVPYTGAGPWTGSCGPGLTVGGEKLRSYLQERYPSISSIGGFACRHIVGNSSKASVHSTGRALDIMIPTVGGAEADNGSGDPIANFLIANAEDLGIQYLIWDRTSWGAHRSDGAKERYYSGAHSHNDHLHVELSVDAGNANAAWLQAGWQPIEVDGSGATTPPEDEPLPPEPDPEPQPEPQEDPPEDIPPGTGTNPDPMPEEPRPSQPCQYLPEQGGIIDADSGCVWLRGPADYWKRSAAGHDGELAWTTAFQSGSHMNYAEWAIGLDKPGRYQVEIYVEPEYAQLSRARYELRHGQTTSSLTIDLNQADGWYSLGDFEFEDGRGDQRLTLFDNSDTFVPDDTRIVVDAIRIRPLQQGGSDEPSDVEETPEDDEPVPPTDDGTDEFGEQGGSLVMGGCQQAPGQSPWASVLLLLGAFALIRRRRSLR